MRWQDRAACAGLGKLFFPEGQMSPTDVERARDVCMACPVRAECLDLALSFSDDPVGVWGGTSEKQRRKIRRERTPTCRECGVEVGRGANGRPAAKRCDPCKEARRLEQQTASFLRSPASDPRSSCVVCRAADAVSGAATCGSWACQKVHQRRSGAVA